MKIKRIKLEAPRAKLKVEKMFVMLEKNYKDMRKILRNPVVKSVFF